ncbi:protein IQ-DOMAIN 22-like [Manihot esculenta]|uniref:protein IQ-DOMAIN 22-like n=1 Tax=Manihot esculenta TaxID=3983 RepID=UPI001CC45C9A|nr:protein IQ-DOMAIN 22-like [Manihot esculenta]
MKDENLAAIKIQSAFRGYLARKALRALKGVVKLQAIVRGQVVRRQVGTKLKRLPSNAKMRSKVRVTTIDICKEGGNKQLSKSKELGEMDSKHMTYAALCFGFLTARMQKPKLLGLQHTFKGRHGKPMVQEARG